MNKIEPFLHNPAFGVMLTLCLYCSAVYFKRRWGWIHPLILTSGIIMIVLQVRDIPLAWYKSGGDWISWALGPATVALAVPLYKHVPLIRSKLSAVLAGITAGSIVSALSTAGLLAASGASSELLFSALSKSSSAPFSMEIASRLGGIPELAAALSVLTGLLGSLAGPAVLRLCGVKEDVPLGAAVGTGSHGIGTARLMLTSELQGSVSGFAMASAGLITSLLMLPVYWWL